MSGRVFADTSGFLALLDAGDELHIDAARGWRTLIETGTKIVTTDYVRLESWALIQRRLGAEAVTVFCDDILGICGVEPVGEDGFQRIAAQWLTARRRKLSLVDLASFDCMRRNRIHTAFTFDEHFEEQGFSRLR